MSTPKTDLITPAEYLEIERKAETKSEYIDGRMYAMSGASEAHNIITLNIGSELRSQLRGRPCRAYVADMRVKVSATGAYTYPDVVAVCGERQLEDEHVDTLQNPTVIIEVLSRSTEAFDRGEKFFHYGQIESLQEYVLVAQDRIHVDHYVRDGERWVFSSISKVNGRLVLPSVGCDVSLAQIYENVDFS